MKSLINYITTKLERYYSITEAREIAFWIIEEITGLTRAQALTSTQSNIIIPELDEIILRLQNHEPIQYIFGHTEWMGLNLQVTPATLIPRPETAELVEWIISICNPATPQHLLDIGTGSGCIAIALKQRCPLWQITGIDISNEALEVAQMNAQKNNVDIMWKKMDILTENADFIDIIVSNPPYICHKEKTQMDARVLEHEPHSALFVPDNDPLLFYRRIASMKSSKYLFFEINEAYGKEICDMLLKLGYTDIQLKNDIYGKARMVFGRIEI